MPAGSLHPDLSQPLRRVCVIVMGFCFSETPKCCQAVMYTKGIELCAPCSAVLDVAAGTWPGRNQGSGGNCCLPRQAAPAGKANLLCSPVKVPLRKKLCYPTRHKHKRAILLLVLLVTRLPKRSPAVWIIFGRKTDLCTL